MADEDDQPVFVRQGTLEIEQQVALQIAVRSYGVALAPVLGVRHKEVDRLSAELHNLPFDDGVGVCLIGKDLHYLMAQHGEQDVEPYAGWLVENDMDAATVADEIARAIDECGDRFFQPLGELDSIIENLARTKCDQFQLAHLAIATHVSGRLDDAVGYLEEFAARAALEPPFVATQSWGFVRSFVDRFNVDEGGLAFRIPD
ncbi:hypothetical protein ACIBEJ_48215 [Nonomuraea sp. NPDC050790]|uniref:hypothetical protein n=1 Tax=Nonomuraea sp. NPDC050790 TaxID=3364371 RepID=UPI0037A38BCB